MFKFAVVGGKGGTTKTTIARAIAVRLCTDGLKVAGFDLDGEQASFNRWVQRRKETDRVTFPIQSIDVDGLAQRLKHLAYDAAVIDGGAYVSRDTLTIARIADLVVMPTGYGLDDIESLVRIIDKLEKQGIPRKKICVVFSKVSESKAQRKQTAAFLEQSGVFVAKGVIPVKDSYFEAMDSGLSICEVKNAPRLRTMARITIDSILERALSLTGE